VAIRAVVFDLGHTLWDYAPTEAARRYNVLRLHDRLAQELAEATPEPSAIDRAIGAVARRWFRDWDERIDGYVQPPSDRLIAEALGSLGLALPDSVVTELTAIFFGSSSRYFDTKSPLSMPASAYSTAATLGYIGPREAVVVLSRNGTTNAGRIAATRPICATSWMRGWPLPLRRTICLTSVPVLEAPATTRKARKGAKGLLVRKAKASGRK